MNTENDFSGIPALDDTEGMEQLMQNQTLAAAGVTPADADSQTSSEQTQQQQTQTQTQPQQGTQGLDPNGLTREDLAKIIAQADAIRQQKAQTQGQPQTRGGGNVGYTQVEQQFIANALARGYDLATINSYIMQRRNQMQDPYAVARNQNAALAQRVNALENYLRSQEYQAAQTDFIDKLSGFGEKWGLSDHDLVVFGQTALQKGINIATPGIDFETVFRAIYPEQYSIRAQRMTPSNTSQIIGGSNVPEGNRRAANAMEDAYVESFLKQHMPNQYMKK